MLVRIQAGADEGIALLGLDSPPGDGWTRPAGASHSSARNSSGRWRSGGGSRQPNARLARRSAEPCLAARIERHEQKEPCPQPEHSAGRYRRATAPPKAKTRGPPFCSPAGGAEPGPDLLRYGGPERAGSVLVWISCLAYAESSPKPRGAPLQSARPATSITCLALLLVVASKSGPGVCCVA